MSVLKKKYVHISLALHGNVHRFFPHICRMYTFRRGKLPPRQFIITHHTRFYTGHTARLYICARKIDGIDRDVSIYE